jgi:hypothetical protein
MTYLMLTDLSSGFIIWQLINNGANDILQGPQVFYQHTGLRWCNEVHEWRMDDPIHYPWPYQSFPLHTYYTPDLRCLALRCLNWNQADRISLLEARDHMEESLARHPNIRDDRNMGPLVQKRDLTFALGGPYKGRKERQDVWVELATACTRKSWHSFVATENSMCIGIPGRVAHSTEKPSSRPIEHDGQ